MVAKKAVFTKPASQEWAEQALEDGFASDRVLSTFDSGEKKSDDDGRSTSVEGNDTSAYIGVDPIYQNYAEDTHAPLKSGKGVEKELEKSVYEEDGTKEMTEGSKPEDSAKTEPTSTGSTNASSPVTPKP